MPPRRRRFIAPNRVPSVLEDERQVAWRAMQNLRKLTPQLNHFARSITGNPKMNVKVSPAVPHTNGNVISIRPPLGLGKSIPHDRSNCGMRDEFARQICPACRVREVIEFFLFHEIAHAAFGTQVMPNKSDYALAEKFIEEWHPVEACNHAGEIRKKVYDAPDPLNVGLALTPYLSRIFNCLEDVRVNSRMFDARPGMRRIFDLNVESLMHDGTEVGLDKRIKWSEEPLDAQFMVGLFMIGSGKSVEGVLHPSVVDALHDPRIIDICNQTLGCKNPHEIFKLSLDAFRIAQDLGYCVVEKCTPAPPNTNEDNQENPGIPLASEDNCDSGSTGSDSTNNPENAGSANDSSDSGPSKQDDSSGTDSEERNGSDGLAPEDRNANEGSEDLGDDSETGNDKVSSPGERSNDDENEERSDESDGNPGTGGRPSSEDEVRDDDQEYDDEDLRSDSGGSPGSEPDSDPEEDEQRDDSGDDDSLDGEASDETVEGDASEPEWPEPEGVDEPPLNPWEYNDEGDDAAQVDEGANDDGGDGQSMPPSGTLDDIDRMLYPLTMHGNEEYSGMLDSMAGGDAEDVVGTSEDGELSYAVRELITTSSSQVEYFDDASYFVAGVDIVTWEKNRVKWVSRYEPDSFAPPESIIGRAVLIARRSFEDNARAKHLANQKSGRINTRVLGRRAPFGDPRIFTRKVIPGKKSYFVVIGADCSGSTSNDYRNPKIKRAVYAQADILTRLGIPWVGYGHSAYLCPADKFPHRTRDGMYRVYMLPFKSLDEAWNDHTKRKLANISPIADNLDGHTLEFYRKVAQRSDATNKIIIYYTDGEMPAANFSEELEILQRELKICKKLGITVLGVGINTDSPSSWGMNTVRIDSDEDVYKVAVQLGEELTKLEK